MDFTPSRFGTRQAFDPYFARSRVPFLSRSLVFKAKVARRYRAARSIARELEFRDWRRRLKRMRVRFSGPVRWR
jgi:hypothetical protein